MRGLRRRDRLRLLSAVLAGGLAGCEARPSVIRAGPDDYRAAVVRLKPGQTLELAAGDYRHCLAVVGLRGRPDARIVIRGPTHGPRPRFLGSQCARADLRRSATVMIEDARWVTLRGLELDGEGAPVSGVRAGFGRIPVVGLRLERLHVHDHDAGQQFSAISSFATAWDWTIEGNVIERVGLGMYLGNSNGEDPFIRGRIEGNVVRDPIGYGIQIKHQRPRRSVPGMPEGPSVTRVRRNVILKTRGGSAGKAARPNLLIGAFPESGAGSEDVYEVRGNVVIDNDSDTEPLIQAEGRVRVHDNLLINEGLGTGLLFRPHYGRVRDALVTHNTVWARGVGVAILDADPASRVAFERNVVVSDGFPRVAGGLAAAGNAVRQTAPGWLRELLEALPR